MKNIVLLAIIFAVSCQNQPSKKVSEQNSLKSELKTTSNNWIQLFDGKTFSGWHQYNKSKMSPAWTIEEGAMKFSPEVESYGRGHNIVTDNEYTNFELSIEWKISEGGNSGIFWGVKEDPKYFEAYQTGPEIQVLDNENFFTATKLHRSPSLYDLVGPDNSNVKVNPHGEWNHLLLKIDHKNNIWLIPKTNKK